MAFPAETLPSFQLDRLKAGATKPNFCSGVSLISIYVVAVLLLLLFPFPAKSQALITVNAQIGAIGCDLRDAIIAAEQIVMCMIQHVPRGSQMSLT